MANYLASIFGTEQDKVNCSFYYKIGACRHGDRCSRKHVKPSYSQTILLPNLYQKYVLLIEFSPWCYSWCLRDLCASVNQSVLYDEQPRIRPQEQDESFPVTESLRR